MLAFSFTLPATRVAVEELDPTFVGIGREALAALPAALLLVLLRGRPPTRSQLLRLGLVALGVVFGFPLFSALALRQLTSAHSAVVVGLLPAATAVAAVARRGATLAKVLARQPRRASWRSSRSISVPVAAAAAGSDLSASSDAWLGFGYVTAVSALLGCSWFNPCSRSPGLRCCSART